MLSHFAKFAMVFLVAALVSAGAVEAGFVNKQGGEGAETLPKKLKKHSNEERDLLILRGGLNIIIQGSKVLKKPKKQPTVATTKKKPAAKTVAKKKPVVTTATKKKPKPKPKPVVAEPKPKPTYTPPVFPVMATLDCDDCFELWYSIIWYESIIDEDSRKLFDRQQEIEDRKAEIAELEGKIHKASTIDRQFYGHEIARHNDFIKEIEALNRDLEALIKEEWKILLERIDQYTECLDKYCPVPVVPDYVEEAQKEAVPALPEGQTTLPEPEKPWDSVEYKMEWTALTELKYGYKDKYGGLSFPEGTGSGPASTPNLPPLDDRKICGPDITQSVLATLKNMRQKYNDNPDMQAGACRSLIDPRTAPAAWDIIELSPGVAVPNTANRDPPEPPYNYERDSDSWVQRNGQGEVTGARRPWFTSTSHMCAIPRNDPECAPTVEFMGICEHAQVVNYIQWRFMLGLCGGAYPAVGPGLHKAWNLYSYGFGAPRQSQDNMSEVAKKVLEKLDANPDETDFTDVADMLKGLNDGIENKAVKNCALKCGIKITRPFDYNWTGLVGKRPFANQRLDRDIRTMGGAGVDMVTDKARDALNSSSIRPGTVIDWIRAKLGV